MTTKTIPNTVAALDALPEGGAVMTTADWIKTRRELLNAATEGPWRWSNRQGVYLFGKRSRVVMAFGRMGMHGAQPQFCDERGILQDGGRANLNSFPDAALIADARTSLPLALEALEAVLALLPEQGSADEDRPAGELGYLIERAIETALEES